MLSNGLSYNIIHTLSKSQTTSRSYHTSITCRTIQRMSALEIDKDSTQRAVNMLLYAINDTTEGVCADHNVHDAETTVSASVDSELSAPFGPIGVYRPANHSREAHRPTKQTKNKKQAYRAKQTANGSTP